MVFSELLLERGVCITKVHKHQEPPKPKDKAINFQKTQNTLDPQHRTNQNPKRTKTRSPSNPRTSNCLRCEWDLAEHLTPLAAQVRHDGTGRVLEVLQGFIIDAARALGVSS